MSATLHEDLSTFYCCWQCRFVIKTFLCNTSYLYIVDSDIYLNNTHKMRCCLSSATVVTRHGQQCYIICTSPIFPRYFDGLAEQERRPVLLGPLSCGIQRFVFGYRSFRQHVGPILKCQAEQERFFLECLAIGMGQLQP